MNWYKKAKKLEEVPLIGTLEQADNGYTYLNVSNKIIDGLFELIEKDGLSKPPYNQKKYNEVGAHISVFNEDEVEDLEIKEIGKEFNFTLGEFKSTKPEGWEEVKEVYFVQVDSPELEDLRKKYKLPKKLNGHEFHITIAVDETN